MAIRSNLIVGIVDSLRATRLSRMRRSRHTTPHFQVAELKDIRCRRTLPQFVPLLFNINFVNFVYLIIK